MEDASNHTPRVLPAVRVEDDGRIHISRRKLGPFGTRVLRFFRIGPDLTFHLDDLGSAAWRLLDGRTVGEVHEGLRERFPEEAYLGHRLGTFLAALVENKFIELDPPA